MPEHVIRALYSAETIRVYQAYGPEIAKPALAVGRFVPPFSQTRMTWIKPSFNWMMYRSGYGSKPGQEVILGIDITREGFDWALQHATLSRFTPNVHSSHEEWRTLLAKNPVRVQWDPERDWRLNPISGVRAIQVGLSGEAVQMYVDRWIVRIEDVTQIAYQVADGLRRGTTPNVLPHERELGYPVSPEVQAAICRE